MSKKSTISQHLTAVKNGDGGIARLAAANKSIGVTNLNFGTVTSKPVPLPVPLRYSSNDSRTAKSGS
jgi:hypothetical protein